jgi:putative hydrolase of the HAD superfamily
MKYLCNEIPWERIKAVGFDMDGTIYDEYDFIYQVYQSIANTFSNSNHSSTSILKSMLKKWLEEGSSYPYIFSEIAVSTGCLQSEQEKKIHEALMLFRNFKPELQISQRIRFLLEDLKEKYELFLVSDGSSALQWNKIKALNLENYFNKQNIFVSGDFGKGAEKPNLMSLDFLKVFKKELQRDEVVFVGDRFADENYSKNAGFNFINIDSVFNRK